MLDNALSVMKLLLKSCEIVIDKNNLKNYGV